MNGGSVWAGILLPSGKRLYILKFGPPLMQFKGQILANLLFSAAMISGALFGYLQPFDLALQPEDEPGDYFLMGWTAGPPPGKGKGGGGGGGGSSDPPQSIPWGIERIKADDVWPITSGAAINVAVFDTGIDASHSDLSSNVMGGTNFACNSPKRCKSDKWSDGNGHGTHVAGTIAAQFNTIGVVGVAHSVNLYAYKVLSDSGSGSWTWLSNALDHAVGTHTDSDPDNDIDLITMSLSGGNPPASVGSSIAAAYNTGIVLVAAAGNAGDGDPSTEELAFPAAFSQVIGVGATDDADMIAPFSSSGSHVEASAPGVDVISTYPGGYAIGSGTSMATPHVTGALALLLTVAPGSWDTNGNGWDPSEVRAKLAATSVDLGPSGWDAEFGHGLVDAAALVA